MLRTCLLHEEFFLGGKKILLWAQLLFCSVLRNLTGSKRLHTPFRSKEESYEENSKQLDFATSSFNYVSRVDFPFHESFVLSLPLALVLFKPENPFAFVKSHFRAHQRFYCAVESFPYLLFENKRVVIILKKKAGKKSR